MSRRDRASDSPMSFFSFQDIIACITGIMVLTTLLLALELIQRRPDAPPVPTPAPQVDLKELQSRRDALRRDVSDLDKTIRGLAAGEMVTATQLGTVREGIRNVIVLIPALRGGAEDAAKNAKRLRDDIEQAKKELEDMTSLAAKMKSQLTNLPGKVFGKKAIYVECSAAGATLAEVADSGADANFLRKVGQVAGDQWPLSLMKLIGSLKHKKEAEAYVLLVRPDAVIRWQQLRGLLAQEGFDVGWDVWPDNRKLFGGP